MRGRPSAHSSTRRVVGPLRCCLTTSAVGERIAIVAFSPFPWTSAYRETGPVVVHADACQGPDGSFPERFDLRDQIVRAFGNTAERSRSQVYDLHRWVRAGEGLARVIEGFCSTTEWNSSMRTTSWRSATASRRCVPRSRSPLTNSPRREHPRTRHGTPRHNRCRWLVTCFVQVFDYGEMGW